MDEFREDDVYEAEAHCDPKGGDWIRVFRNGAACIECLPLAELLANPQVREVIVGLAKTRGVPFKSWYEEFSRDD